MELLQKYNTSPVARGRVNSQEFTLRKYPSPETQMFQRFESIISPIGPLDVQIHRSSLTDNIAEMIRDAVDEGLKNHPDKIFNGYEYEIVPDGAGVKHYNLKVHFASQNVALDPTNMNNAPSNIFGNTLDRAELERRGIGQYDTRWRGIPDTTRDVTPTALENEITNELGKPKP